MRRIICKQQDNSVGRGGPRPAVWMPVAADFRTASWGRNFDADLELLRVGSKGGSKTWAWLRPKLLIVQRSFGIGIPTDLAEVFALGLPWHNPRYRRGGGKTPRPCSFLWNPLAGLDLGDVNRIFLFPPFRAGIGIPALACGTSSPGGSVSRWRRVCGASSQSRPA